MNDTRELGLSVSPVATPLKPDNPPNLSPTVLSMFSLAATIASYVAPYKTIVVLHSYNRVHYELALGSEIATFPPEIWSNHICEKFGDFDNSYIDIKIVSNFEPDCVEIVMFNDDVIGSRRYGETERFVVFNLTATMIDAFVAANPNMEDYRD